MTFALVVIVGGVLAVTGAVLAVVRSLTAKRAEPVQLLVVDVAAKWVEQGVREKFLMYEVMDGRHKGYRSMSLVSRPIAPHSIGDRIDGMVDPNSRAVLSLSDARFRFWQAVWIACVGVLMVCAALIWPRN